MKVTQEELSPLNLALTLELESADYSPKVTAALKKVRKNLQLKGFRTGMVPMGYVKKMYGDHVLSEEINKMIHSEVQNYLAENNIEILFQALPVESEKQTIDINQDKSYSFKLEVGVKPSFEIPEMEKQFRGMKKYLVSATDEKLEEEISRLRKGKGKVEHPEEIIETDVVQFQFDEVLAKGAEGEPISNVTWLPMDSFKEGKHRNAILKLKKGKSAKVKLFDALEREPEQIKTFVLGLEKESEQEVSDNFKVTIVEINRVAEAELTEEFFQQVYQDPTIKTEEEFRAKVKTELENAYVSPSQKEFFSQIRTNLLKKVPMDLPSAFIKKYLTEGVENPSPIEKIEEDFPLIEEDVKWTLIKNRIARDKELKITEDEIRQFAKMDTLYMMYQYYGGVQNPQQLEEIVNMRLKEEQYTRQVHEQILEDKIRQHFDDKWNMKTTKISIEEFTKLTAPPTAEK